jgi:hypothetical protein
MGRAKLSDRFGNDDLTNAKRQIQANVWENISKETDGLKSALLLCGPDVRAEVRMVRESQPQAFISVIDNDKSRIDAIRTSTADKGYFGELMALDPVGGVDVVHADLCGNLRGQGTRDAITAAAGLANHYLVVTFTYCFDRHLELGLHAVRDSRDLPTRERTLLSILPNVVSDRLVKIYSLICDKAPWHLRRVYTYGGSRNERYPMMTVVFGREARIPWNPIYYSRSNFVVEQEAPRATRARAAVIETSSTTPAPRLFGMAALSPAERSKVAQKAAATRRRRAAARKAAITRARNARK